MKSFMVVSQHVSLVNKTRHAVVLSQHGESSSESSRVQCWDMVPSGSCKRGEELILRAGLVIGSPIEQSNQFEFLRAGCIKGHVSLCSIIAFYCYCYWIFTQQPALLTRPWTYPFQPYSITYSDCYTWVTLAFLRRSGNPVVLALYQRGIMYEKALLLAWLQRRRWIRYVQKRSF